MNEHKHFQLLIAALKTKQNKLHGRRKRVKLLEIKSNYLAATERLDDRMGLAVRRQTDDDAPKTNK